jgi:hypothetical protein
MRARTGVGFSIALGLLASVVHAQRGLEPPYPSFGPPLLLRLEGVVQTSPVRREGFAIASLGFLGEGDDRASYLDVTDARTVGGDHTLDGKEVLNAVAPFTPNLLVTGPPSMVALLRDAPAGRRVRLEGLVSRGSRTYYLRNVEVEPKVR